MEREFLQGVDFRLYVDKSTYDSWLNLLRGLVLAKEREHQRWLSRRRVPSLALPNPHPHYHHHNSSSNINSCHREARRGGVEGASPTCSLMRRVQHSARGAQVRIGLHIATPRRTHSLSLSPTPRQPRRRLRLRLLPPLPTPLLSHPPRSSKLRRTRTRSLRARHQARLPARTRITMLR